MAKTQLANDFRAQLATWHSIDGRVDGFVRNLQCGCGRIHKRQYASNLHRRVARFQVVDDLIPQGSSRLQAARHARGDLTSMGARMGRVGTLAACHRRAPRATTPLRSRPAVSTEFARQRRGRTMQPHGNRCWLDAHLQLCLDHRPFFKTQLRIDVSLATFSPINVALGF
jgi:hypothetical protein